MSRIIFNARCDKYDDLFEGTLSGKEIEQLFQGLLPTANAVLDKKYDEINTGEEDIKEAIQEFKVQNAWRGKFEHYYDIPLEDWFLLFRLFFLANPDLKNMWKASKAGLEWIILDAIYNDGEIVFEKVSEDKAIVNDEAESDENDAPTAYRNLIEKYETEYGSANLNEQEQFWTGLCFAKLLDFNGDGVDELILAYQTEPSNIDNVEYTVELWEFDGTSVERVASQISWTGNNIPYFGGFSISKYEEKYLLVLTDNAGGDISYYGTKDDGSIGLVHELIWKGDAMEGDWYLDDEMISRETYEEYYNKYRSDSIWYGFSEESCNETIQEEISQTKDKLKM